MKKILALLACLISTSALAQTETFSTYVTGLAPASSVIGTERMFALQTGVPKTMTPYQILSNMAGDCTMAAPPAIVCTKINGLTLASPGSATTNTQIASNITSGTLPLARLALANAQIYVGNVSNVPVSVALSGDCTISNLGAVTCTKTNNVSFAASATTDTTVGTNITTGTVAAARLGQINLAASGNGGVGGVLPFANHPTGSLDQTLGYFGSTTLNAIGVPNCAGALQYSTSTHTFGCGAGGGNVTVSGSPITGQIATWATGSAIQGVALSSLSTVSKVKTQSFSSSGTYTPSAGLQFAIMECVGGGGAGGGSAGQSTPQIFYVNGGGGGGGSYARAIASAATIGGGQTVSIGNGGTAANGANGGNGGATSVGALCVAGGGSGGTVGSTTAVGVGGQGGIATAGNTIVTSGGAGQSGIWLIQCASCGTLVQGPSGAGGSSIWGGGGVGVAGIDPSVTSGSAGLLYGGGGSGAQSNDNGAVNGTGGAGANGAVIITEFTNQ